MSRRTRRHSIARSACIRAARSAWFAGERRCHRQTVLVGSELGRRRPDLCPASRTSWAAKHRPTAGKREAQPQRLPVHFVFLSHRQTIYYWERIPTKFILGGKPGINWLPKPHEIGTPIGTNADAICGPSFNSKGILTFPFQAYELLLGRQGHVEPGKSHGVEAVIANPKGKLLDQVREVMRLRHYSIRTEQSYCDWIRRYVKFHRMQSREELAEVSGGKVEMFLSDLAVNGHVSASTQNQAFNALLFLYREILKQPFENVQAVRADRPVRVPIVLTTEEARQIITAMSGVPQIVVKLLYGSGLRLKASEALARCHALNTLQPEK